MGVWILFVKIVSVFISSPPWTSPFPSSFLSPHAVDSKMLKGKELKRWLQCSNGSRRLESQSWRGWESGTWRRAGCPQAGLGGRLWGGRLLLPWLPTAAGWQGRCWPGPRWEAGHLAAPGLPGLEEIGPRRPAESGQQKPAGTSGQEVLLPSSHNLVVSGLR